MICKDQAQCMLEQFGSYGGNCYPPIVIYIATAALLIFDDGDNRPTFKLRGDKCMAEHAIEKKHETHY